MSENGATEQYGVIDATVTSNAADGATVDINGTRLLIQQAAISTLVEIWVEDETKPLGCVNIANGETVALGGIDESLSKEVDKIRELPVEDIPDALDGLAYRLNPAAREKP